MKYDVFISHASEDKNDFVHGLAKTLEESGLSVWYDDFILREGDSVAEWVDAGLSQSTFGIVVLSPVFFQKDWPKRELNLLLSREREAEKVVIPIWHNTTKCMVLSSFPLMADKYAVMSNDEMGSVVERIFEIVEPSRIAKTYYEQGLILEDNEAPNEAKAAYIKALRLEPTLLEALRGVNRLQNLGLPQALYDRETHIKVGIVKFYNKKKGFGLIAGENGKEYFVHASRIEPRISLHDGARVVFLAEFSDRGVVAAAVRSI